MKNTDNDSLMCYMVSVVIPTIGSPFLKSAIHSALAQRYGIHEILVIADTIDDIDIPIDDRIKVFRIGPRAGGNAARQHGIQLASGNVIALLDEDDEWLPTKIETQIHAVKRSVAGGEEFWMSSTRIFIRTLDKKEVMVPRVKYASGQSLVEYLFKKKSIKSHQGYIQSSSMLFPRSLALKVPFDGKLKFHQDISWVVDVSCQYPDLIYVQCWEGLVVKNSVQGSVSRKITPTESIEWAKNRLAFNRRIMGDFILTQSLFFAKRNGSLKQMIHTISQGIKVGTPGISAIAQSLLSTVKAVITGRAK